MWKGKWREAIERCKQCNTADPSFYCGKRWAEKMQIQGQEHFEKELAKERDKYTGAKGCSKPHLKRMAGSNPSKLPRHSGSIPFSRRFPVSARGIYTTECQCHPLARTCSASVGSQDVCSHAGTGPAPSCLLTSRPLDIHPCGTDNVWFHLQSLQARKVLRADKAKP